MTDRTTDDNTVEFSFCPACFNEQSWVILEALAKPYGGIESEGWRKALHKANPALCAAIDIVLAPFLELENVEHIGEPDDASPASAADAGARVH